MNQTTDAAMASAITEALGTKGIDRVAEARPARPRRASIIRVCFILIPEPRKGLFRPCMTFPS